ncbi:MAG: cytochrome B [Calditrichaeota bacterium]|nr:cytochrome B [Calditrichota bacterium]
MKIFPKQLTFLPFLLIFPLLAQINQDCFDCHDDAELTMERKGKEISLYINPDRYQAAAHGEQRCVDCHQQFDPEELPHAPRITPVNCRRCHQEISAEFARSPHARELRCTSCHQDLHAPEERRVLVQECGDCHEEEADVVAASIHGQVEKGASCADCHSPHAVKAVDSPRCLACHGKKEFVHTSVYHKSLEFILSYQESIHAEVIECADCHGGHDIFPADSLQSRVHHQNIVSTCASCHEDEAEEFVHSEHGNALAEGFQGAPTCTDCHGEHDIHQITDSRSPVSREHEIEVCLDCHLDSPEVTRRMTHSKAFIADYKKSIHGRLFEQGQTDVAICSDCHTAHGERKASDPASTVNKFNIPKTCGTCHQEVVTQYGASIHGEALQKGVEDAPGCTDCHGEHKIIEPERPESPVSPQHVSEAVCAPCHRSVRLAEKFGIPSDRYTSYIDSYHGLAVRAGQVQAANCASCHGVHDILPSTDPRSRVNKANLARTCGECHPGASENFAKGKVHIVRSPEGDKWIYWISSLYMILIVVTIGFMAVHNGLDWLRKTIERYRERYREAPAGEKPKKRRLYLRMTVNERIQHGLLAISFLTLVFTGFMLKFPDAWWVVWLRKLGGVTIFELRGIVHRVAAVVMVADALYHLYYIGFTRRGRQFIRDMMFRLQDVRDMIQVLKYNLGKAKTRPKFGRFNYIEKIEYWALIWGTIVMTVTGLALWFEAEFIGLFSLLFVEVCETIHYFEAWLAFLAIVVWHFYYVIFNPDVYPMNFSWLTGTITEEEMEKEHPLELEKERPITDYSV